MYKGQEYSAVINEDISDSKDFTYRAYQKALIALDDIAKRTGELTLCGKKDLCGSTLYRYCQNMIVFSGARGQGKTSAMLSFSATLKDQKRLNDVVSKEDLEHLKDCSFLVMEPIDPTVLEQGQNLLALVLSRMLSYSERQWNDNNTDYCGRFQDRAAERNKLLKLYQDCLNGINVVKSGRDSGVIKSLTDVHKISDSSVLKENFYRLAKMLLDNAFPGELPVKNKFLVLQFDDTDFQIARGYEVMEDIRKYLTVPNIVILMATDTDLLRKVLTQHYASEFNDSLNRGLIESPLLSGISAKYLAKLVPPTYTAYMPHLDEEIRDQRRQIALEYSERGSDGKPGKNLISPEPDADKEVLSKYSFQDTILRYIYKKTHLIFASHSAYMNNIIPTTLRGLAQLLSLLEFMEDVPEVSPDDMRSPDALVARLKGQLPILHHNLELFESYFTNDWIQAKLNVKQTDVIQKLAGQAPGQRVQFAAGALRAYYEPGKKPNANIYTDYSDLEELIAELQRSHRQPEDYYFFFAIHTFFTIKNNKTILEIRQNTCDRWTSGPLVFHFLAAESSLPRYFYLSDAEYGLGSRDIDLQSRHLIVKSFHESGESDTPNIAESNNYLVDKHLLDDCPLDDCPLDECPLDDCPLDKCLLDKCLLDKCLGEPHSEFPGEPHFSYWFKSYKTAESWEYTFSFLGLLTSALNPVYTYEEGLKEDFGPSLYQLQELACAVAANADVRDKVRKCFRNQSISRPDGAAAAEPGADIYLNSTDYAGAINYAYQNVIFKEIAAINTPEGRPPMNDCFGCDIGVVNVLRSFINRIEPALNYIGTLRWSEYPASDADHDPDSRRELEEALKQYYRLAIDYISVSPLNRNELDFLTSARRIFNRAPKDRKIQSSLDDMSTCLVEKLRADPAARNVKGPHNRKLSAICKANGIDYETIKTAR